MHIGLLGGSFDPIHNAHVAVALSALQIRELDQVQLIPAGQPWQKPALHASPTQRADMIALAIEGIVGLSLNTMELERSGATYTIDTLESLDQRHTYYWILGSDQLANFCSWHRWQDITRKVTLLVAGRPDADQRIPLALQEKIDQRQAKVEFLPFEPMPVSASELRRRIANHEVVDGMISPAVQHYIQQHHLYQNSVQE